jgi:hypothetical protein
VRAVLRAGTRRADARPARDHELQSQLDQSHGCGRRGYLASPSVVAASAMLGYMAPPSELGLHWDAEAFAV